MGTTEQRIAMLFLVDLREKAGEAAQDVAKKGVKRLREPACQNAFVNEWTIARLAWIERYADSITNSALLKALKEMIREAVPAYDGNDDVRFVDYSLLAISLEQGKQSGHGLGTLFLKGLGNRLKKIPRKPSFFGRHELSVDEQVEIMDTVIKFCWTMPCDLEKALEAFRPRA